MPVLSLVIPTHRRANSLERLLASIARQDLRRDEFEVLVVANLDDSETRRVCEAVALRGLEIRFLVVGSIGANRARNLGIENSRGEVLLFLDDDCRLARVDHLSKLVETFTLEVDLDVRGGPYLSSPESTRIGRSYNALVNAWAKGRSIDRPLFAGGNLAVRRVRLGDVRFDDAIDYGGSEISFQIDLQSNGAKARWDESSGVFHEIEATPMQIARKAWRQGSAKKEWGGGSALRSLAFFVEEGLENLPFGLCFGGISRAAWLASKVSRTLSSRQ